MGLFFRGASSPKASAAVWTFLRYAEHIRHHGSLQVLGGDIQEETFRPAAVYAPHSRMAVPPTFFNPPCFTPHTPGQGTPLGVQGQAGLCHLSRAGSPWWPQTPRPQGSHVW